MRIPCPHCGERDVAEFRYGGDAANERPTHGKGDLKAWHDYKFLFENPKGPHEEYWQHVLGCRQWFKLERDTATNTVLPSPLEGEGAQRADEGVGGNRTRSTSPSSVLREGAQSTFSLKGRRGGKET